MEIKKLTYTPEQAEIAMTNFVRSAAYGATKEDTKLSIMGKLLSLMGRTQNVEFTTDEAKVLEDIGLMAELPAETPKAESKKDAAPAKVTTPKAKAKKDATPAKVAVQKPKAKKDAAKPAVAKTQVAQAQKEPAKPAVAQAQKEPAKAVAENKKDTTPVAQPATAPKANKAQTVYNTPLANLGLNLTDTDKKTYDVLVRNVAEKMTRKDDGSLDIDTVKNFTLKDIEETRVLTLDNPETSRVFKDLRDFVYAHVQNTKAEPKKELVGALYQNYAKLDKDDQAKLTSAVMTLARTLPPKKDGSPNTDIVQLLSKEGIEKSIKANQETIKKYDDMVVNQEPTTTEQDKAWKNAKVAVAQYKELQTLVEKYSGKFDYNLTPELEKANAAIKAEHDERWAITNGAIAVGDAISSGAGAVVGGIAAGAKWVDDATGNAISGTIKQGNEELGISQMFDAAGKADDRVWEYVKDGKWYGARAAAQLVGEVGAQATAVTAATGEHIKKYPEMGLNAINDMEEGAVKEATQSTAGVALNAVSAVANTVSGITNLASWVLKGGEYTNDDIDRISGQTVKVIAEKMLDKSDANIKNIKTLIDIRQRLGVSDEEFKKLSSDQVEQLIKQRADEKVISREMMLMAYGQITGEVTVDEKGKLIITDKTAGLDQLFKAVNQFDNMIADTLNLPSSATGLLHKGTQLLGDTVSIDDDDSGLEITGKVAAQVITRPVDAVAGTVAGVGDVASGLLKGIWALIPGTETTLADAGNQILKGAKGTVSGGYWGKDGDEAKALADAQAKQTADRKEIAKAHDEVANQKAEVKTHTDKVRTEFVNKFIAESGDKLLDDIVPKERQAELNANIEKVANQQLNGFISAAKERANQPDITPEEKAEAEELILTLQCLKDTNNADNKKKLLELYKKNHPEDKEMTADKLVAEAKAENERLVKESIKDGITALLRAAANKEDAKRLMTLAENDGFLGKDSSWLKTLVNKIDQAYDQNEFGEDHNAFLKFLETTLLDGVILEVPRLVFKESVSTTDKCLLSMICLNFIGSLTWMASGIKKAAKGTKEMYNADNNPALNASGLGKVMGGTAQTALGVLLPKIDCCSHVILGKHKFIDKWMGEDICCHHHHHVAAKPQPIKPPCPPPKPPVDPCPWISDPTLGGAEIGGEAIIEGSTVVVPEIVEAAEIAGEAIIIL
ncbi:MAG: hypothetical protein MJ180_04095 [Candidatus Gastranaerophilales bacterium]|nr:hypothetical protein [Candidatus Gastranaerophilales bacterium]